MPENAADVPRVLVVMPWGRVGSNLLMSYLNSMKAPKTANESLNGLRSAEEQLAWLDDFYFGSDLNPNCEIVSSKQSMLAMVDVKAIEDFVLEKRVRVVRMFRRDPVRTAISQIRAKQYADKTETETGTAAWAVKKEAEPLGPTEIEISALDHRLDVVEEQNARLEASFLGSEPFDVIYEDFVAAMRKTWTALSRYLDLPVVPFRPPFRKATPDNLGSVITNFDEVKAHIESRGLPVDTLAGTKSAGPSEFAEADPLFDRLDEQREQLHQVQQLFRERREVFTEAKAALEEAKGRVEDLRGDIAETERKLLDMC